jgi:serine/threonine protein kinase
MIGHVIGNYKILELIGEGGMGTVYKGIDQMLEREVAVKVPANVSLAQVPPPIVVVRR